MKNVMPDETWIIKVQARDRESRIQRLSSLLNFKVILQQPKTNQIIENQQVVPKTV